MKLVFTVCKKPYVLTYGSPHYGNALTESKARQRELEEKLHEYQAEKRRKKVINATLATAVGIWLLVKSPLSSTLLLKFINNILILE